MKVEFRRLIEEREMGGEQGLELAPESCLEREKAEW